MFHIIFSLPISDRKLEHIFFYLFNYIKHFISFKTNIYSSTLKYILR